MGIIQQDSFSLGEVDEKLFNYTSQAQQYLQALSKCDNAYISAQQLPERRKPFEYIKQYQNINIDSEIIDSNHFSFRSKDELWYQIILINQQSSLTNTDIYLAKFSNDEVQIPTSIKKLNTLVGYSVKDIDITATDNYVVIANSRLHPQKITVDSDNFENSKIENIKFSVIPSIDFGDIDYSDYRFSPKCTDGSDPTGTPLSCPKNSVFGEIINITIPDGSDAFTTDWIGGMVFDRTGASPEQPIGFGLIKHVGNLSNNIQQLKITVLQAFGTEHYSKEGQVWDIRKPIWGDRINGDKVYPSVTSFYKGRLWFANTPDLPMIVAGSKVNQPNNFNVNSGEDNDAIVYLLQNSEGGGIKYIFGGVNLHLFTESEQMSVLSGYDVGISPSNFSPQVTSSYSSSSMKPVKYKNNIYFITSDGKALVEIVEQDKSVSVGIISGNSQHLINQPIKAGVYEVDNNQDQNLALLNKDGSICIFSTAEQFQNKSFSQFNISTISNELINDLSVLNNRLYLYSNSGNILASSANTDFDYGKDGINNNGKVILDYDSNNITVGELFGLNIKYNNYNFYLGEYPAKFDNINKQYYLEVESDNRNVRYGKNYKVTIKTMPLFSSQQGSFKKRKVSQAWVQYFNSFNFTVNGKITALWSSNEFERPLKYPQSISGTHRFSFADGSKQNYFIDIVQKTPYPLNIQKISWIIKESLII